MELLLLLKVKWDPYAPTAKDFLPMLLTNLMQNGFLNEESQKMVKRHAQAYIDLIAIGKTNKIMSDAEEQNSVNHLIGPENKK